ncbi:DUF2934 domain-containing protein [Puniceibacterium confluentis]|uniref:DUF2934 domain-containing protein n=1 Tax=Puniceibacterium confluentis TaxID=1958944 RepID=UPI0011B78C3B|nr:DUF2934 domain-containing protein [Puniceibacterium confluentis]
MPQPDDSDIAQAAYFLWLAEGKPKGRDADHWRRAEQELTGSPSQKRAAKAAPKARATKSATPKAATATAAPKTKAAAKPKAPAKTTAKAPAKPRAPRKPKTPE